MVFPLKRFSLSLQYFPKILKEFFWLFISLHLVNFFFNQTMIFMQEQRMSSKSDDSIPLMFFVAFVGFTAQALIKVVWTLVICHFFFDKKIPLSDFLKKYAEQGLIESLRAFFKAVLWGFLLIIPGLLKMIQYQFVVFIVALDKKYEEGNVDALKRSEDLCKGHLWSLSFLIILFSVLAFSLNPTEFFTANPLSVLACELLGLALVILETIYLLLLFQDLTKVKK